MLQAQQPIKPKRKPELPVTAVSLFVDEGCKDEGWVACGSESSHAASLDCTIPGAATCIFLLLLLLPIDAAVEC
jgi:hypothetical protein